MNELLVYTGMEMNLTNKCLVKQARHNECIPSESVYISVTNKQNNQRAYIWSMHIYIMVIFKGMEHDWETAIPRSLPIYSVWSPVSCRSGVGFPQVHLPPGCYIRHGSLFFPGLLTLEAHALRNRSLIFPGLMLASLISLSGSDPETPVKKPLLCQMITTPDGGLC